MLRLWQGFGASQKKGLFTDCQLFERRIAGFLYTARDIESVHMRII